MFVGPRLGTGGDVVRRKRKKGGGVVDVLRFPATIDVLLLYPGDSLLSQVNAWAMWHPERRVELASERSLPEVRKLLCSAGTALIDATDDPSQAADAFLQAVARLGADAVAVYTETTHEDLESLVREHRSQFFLGPFGSWQWAEVFGRLLKKKDVLRDLQSLKMQRRSLMRSFDRGAKQRALVIRRLRNGRVGPLTGND